MSEVVSAGRSQAYRMPSLSDMTDIEAERCSRERSSSLFALL